MSWQDDRAVGKKKIQRSFEDESKSLLSIQVFIFDTGYRWYLYVRQVKFCQTGRHIFIITYPTGQVSNNSFRHGMALSIY